MIRLYLIVEGRGTEPKLYRAWLPLLLPGMQRVQRLEDLGSADRTFLIVAGCGFPSYLDRIRNAVTDIRQNSGMVTHLLVAVDAEEIGFDERRRALVNLINELKCPVSSQVIVADCCVETWLLGHRRLVCRQPQSRELAEMLRFYNVVAQDPELMPKHSSFSTRAQFHFEYLRYVFRERQLNYAKNNPGEACRSDYFEQLRARALDNRDDPRHLKSFADLLAIGGWLQASEGGTE